jgi:hypothetical protein
MKRVKRVQLKISIPALWSWAFWKSWAMGFIFAYLATASFMLIFERSIVGVVLSVVASSFVWYVFVVRRYVMFTAHDVVVSDDTGPEDV